MSLIRNNNPGVESASSGSSPISVPVGSTLNPILQNIGLGNQPNNSVTPGVGQNGYKPAPQDPFSGASISTNPDGTPVNDTLGMVNNYADFKDSADGWKSWVAGELKNNVLSPTNLLPGQRTLDPSTQGLLTDQLLRAGESNEDTTNKLTAGTDEAAGLLGSSDDRAREATAMGGGNAATDTLSAALERRNKDSFNDSHEGLRRNAAFMAPQVQGNRLKQLSGELSQNEQLRLKNYQEQQNYVLNKQKMDLQLEMAKQQGRSSAIGSILQTVGTVVGIAAAVA